MGLRDEHLAEGESVVMRLRTHRKVLLKPVAWIVVLAAIAVAAWIVAPMFGLPSWAPLFATAAAVLLVIAATIPPYLKWVTTTYVITNQRVSLRTGILTHTGRDIPLYRINDVTFEKQLSDRLFGCGTLVISDGSDREGMVLDDVPDVEQVQRTLQDLVRRSDPRDN
ncbi:PH domain-containing protein [Myceligenerans pegani]|uniref:PH domain-containing protein n=1 Tax=Myceligenerans pegani TaxID=2776917 RepID=A0ABR9N047_9MICO|nr:PH domain-containing protein [Myceligenerans sp. TRM 65318]MBE1877021.1 PH domain-containing protein [Myceligenerans sp. TRM 65318]MBE3019292.1 PH domain-containing protein [Myceligenerans sp. TRM 65318]